MIEGENLLAVSQGGGDTEGFTAVHPLSYFDEFLARRARQFGLEFHLRLSPRDTIDNARVKEIERNYVVLNYNGSDHKIYFAEG